MYDFQKLALYIQVIHVKVCIKLDLSLFMKISINWKHGKIRFKIVLSVARTFFFFWKNDTCCRHFLPMNGLDKQY